MIIPEEKIFNNKVFCLNLDLTCHHVDTETTRLTIIDDFYVDLDLVLHEVEKLPITKVLFDGANNVDFLDGRKVYAQNMMGTQLPFVTQLQGLISKIIEYPKKKIECQDKVLVNCFQFTDKVDLENNYYAIHRDPRISNKYRGQVAIVLFLNKSYNDGEGINFYKPPKENASRRNNFYDKKYWEVEHFVQAKPNRAVLFTSDMYHGQHTGTDQFKSEVRYTQVIFAYLS